MNASRGLMLVYLTLSAGCLPLPGPRVDSGSPDAGGSDAGGLEITLDYDIPSTCQAITLAARRDAAGRPYLYVTAKEGGLRVYELTPAPVLKTTIPISQLSGLDVMNLSQTGNLLFLALGNSFGTTPQHPGFAIVDVTAPATPLVRGQWSDPAVTGGAGIVVSDGSTAYLGAMANGLILFDVSNPAAPNELSRIKPALDFPDSNFDAAKINARGLEVKGNLVYLCYDAGGLRLIDVSSRATPREVGRYSNPALNGKPRAYNNVVLDGTTAWIGADYCGVEALDVSDPANIKQVSWWDPWHCEAGGLTWFSSNGHANEVALDKTNHRLFVSSGKSDLQVLDVTNPATPTHVLEYGGVDNGIGSWGVSLAGDQLLLTYTCAVIPFSSSWSGVKVLRVHPNAP